MEQQGLEKGPPKGWARTGAAIVGAWMVAIVVISTVVAAWPVPEDAAGEGFTLAEVVAGSLYGWIVVLPFAVPGAALSARRTTMGSALGTTLQVLAGVVTFLGAMLLLGASRQTDDA